MNIAHFCPWFHIGGIESHIENIVSSLNMYNHEIVTDNNYMSISSDNNIKRIIRIGPPNIRTKSRIQKWLIPINEFRRLRNQITYMKKAHIDIIHCHAIFLQHFISIRFYRRLFLSLLTDLWASKNIRKPMLFTDHSIFSRWDSYLDSIEFYFKVFDNLICVEKSGYESVVDFIEHRKLQKQVWYIPNSVDTKKFSYKEPPYKQKIVIGYAARLERIQGEIFMDLLKKMPSYIELHIAGAGTNYEVEEYRKLFSNPQVRFFPNTPRDKMPNFYHGIDILFDPITLRANDRVIPEAMSCGRPVIMIGNIDRYPVIDRETGYLIENDIDTLLTLLKDLNKNRDELYKTGKKSRAIIEREYSNVVLMPKLKRVYEDVMNLR